MGLNRIPEYMIDQNFVKKVNDHTSSLAEKVKKGEIVINVKDYGAKGDGIADDTSAIQAAINSLPNGGKVIVPSGIYITSSTITIPAYVTLELMNGVTVTPTTNVNSFQLKAYAILQGGRVDVSGISDFSSAVIYLDSVDYSKSSYSGYVKDIFIRSLNQRGYGIYLHASQPANGGSFIQLMNFSNINLSGFQSGIYINAESVNGNSGDAWINGISFDQVTFNACAYGIRQEKGVSVGHLIDTSGNLFTNFQYQSGTYTLGAVKISGNYNTIKGIIWDIGWVNAGTKVIQLPADSSLNVIETNIGSQNMNVVQDLGSTNLVTNPTMDRGISAGQQIKFPIKTSDQYLFIAKLPVSSGTTYDKLLVKVMGGAYDASSGMINDWVIMGNRDGYKYQYLQQGYAGNSATVGGEQRQYMKVLAYQQADGSVDVYLYCAANKYMVSMVQALGMGLGLTNVVIPLNTVNITTTVPTGTLVFDSYTTAPNAPITPGAFKVPTRSTSLPTAGIDYENRIYVLQGNGTTTASTLHVCLKSSTGTYSWKQIVTG